MRLVEIIGIVPTIIFPLATVSQLVTLLKAKTAAGASAVTWSLFALANLCLYIYVEKFLELQAIVGLLGSAAVDVAIVVLILRYRALDARKIAGS
ncbi:MAG: hypothetical protein QM775_26425 [Pirellulales bacterium]